MTTHTTERQGDGWMPRVIHRAFHVGDPVRVRGDVDGLAGATGTVFEIESPTTLGIRRIDVDVAELGHVRLLAGDIEHAPGPAVTDSAARATWKRPTRRT